MGFNVAADAYGQFMGRYSEPLAERFVGGLTLTPGLRVLDVGAGTGAATALLAKALGPGSVVAVEPSGTLSSALRERLPGVEVRADAAESLPFRDAAFDLTISQLVVHLMADPSAGLAEMARVTAPGGTVAACVWDFAGGRAPLSLFWSVVRRLDPGALDESGLAGAGQGQLEQLFAATGLHSVSGGEITVEVPYGDPEQWWHPYTLGVGPAGAYVASLEPSRRERLREAALEELGDGPGSVAATAWVAHGIAQ